MAVHKEKEYAFSCDAIPGKCFHFFQDIRSKKEFCDVTFQLGNEKIYAHRIIIAAVIPYLREVLMVRNGLQDGEDCISIPEIDSSSFKCLIEFAYSYKLKINEENVWNLLSAACYLKVKEVREACCDFVVDTLELENALNARQRASNLSCSDMVKDIDSYVADNFVKISHTTDFLNCTSGYVEELLCRNDLCVDNEQQVLDAVLRWVKGSTEERSIVLPEMMRKIRMLHVEPESLAKLVITDDLIRTSISCRDLIDEARNYKLFPNIRKEVCSFVTEPRQRMEISDNKDTKYVCSFFAESKYTVQYYDLTMAQQNAEDGCFNRTTSTPQWPGPNYSFGSTRHGSVGSQWNAKGSKSFSDSNGMFAKVEDKMYYFWAHDTVQYDPITDKYEFLSSKPTPNIESGMATFSPQNKIYFFGGKMSQTASNSVESFDPQKNKWTSMKSMRTSRWGLSVVSFGNYIYIMGGQDESAVYDYIERYDPVVDKWRPVSSMLARRSGAGAAVLSGNIYICGGNTLHHGTNGVVATVEIYDPVENISKFVAHLNVSRWKFFVFAHSGKLYALGGTDNNNKNVSTFDIYDPEGDKWIVGPSCPAYITGVVKSSNMDV